MYVHINTFMYVFALICVCIYIYSRNSPTKVSLQRIIRESGIDSLLIRLCETLVGEFRLAI